MVVSQTRSYVWDEWLMKKGQEMYAFYSTPLPKWPAPQKTIDDLTISRILHEASTRTGQNVSVLLASNFKVTDTPRILPFQGVFIKKALARFKARRDKRTRRKFEDWVFREHAATIEWQHANFS